MSGRDQTTIVEETGKLSPDDPSLEMVDAPRLNKKGVKLLFLGLGSVVMVGLVFSLSQDPSPGVASGEGPDGQTRFGVQLPGWLRSDREFQPSAGVQATQELDESELADLTTGETTVYRNDRVVYQRTDTEVGPVRSDQTPAASSPAVSTTRPTTTSPPTPVQPRSVSPRPTTTTTTPARTAPAPTAQPSAQEIMEEQARSARMFYQVQTGPSSSPAVGSATTDTERLIAASLQAQGETDYEAQNQQEQKAQWLASRQVDFSGYVRATPVYPVAPGQELKAGTVIPITMITGINSDLPGDIVAQVIQDVYDSVSGQRLLVPRGSRAIGSYDSSVAFGQDRVLIAWDRIIRPDGVSVALQGMQGVDRRGQSGMADLVDFHIDDIAASVAVSSTFTLGSGALIAWLSSNESLSAIGELLGNDSDAAGEIVEEYATRVLNRQPTIVVRPGVRGSIFVSRDLVLPAYEDWRGGFR